MRDILLVGVGGFLGATARYGLAGLVHRFAGGAFPWGTLAANLLGCLAIGALMGLVEGRAAIPPEARTLLGIGFLGSLTTFSTLEYETLALLRAGQPWVALANAGGSAILGLAAVFAGRLLAGLALRGGGVS